MTTRALTNAQMLIVQHAVRREMAVRTRQIVCESNGHLDHNGATCGVSHDLSTPQVLADFMNRLAHKVGIERTESNPDGYYASADDMQYERTAQA